MKRDLKKLARQQGDEAVAEMLTSLLRMADEIADLELETDPPPRPPARKPGEPKRGPSRRRATDNKAQGDDRSDQPDLF